MGMTHGNARHLPVPGERRSASSGRSRRLDVAEAVVSCSATTATAPTASARASSTSSTTGASSGSAARSSAVPGRPARAAARRSPVTGADDRYGWAGTRRATASGATASASRTAASRTTAAVRLRTGAARRSQRSRPRAALTPMQDLLLCDLSSGDRAAVEAMLDEHGVAAARPCRRRGGTAWRARRSRRAAWRSPRRSASCRASSTSWTKSWPSWAWRRARSACA